MLLTKSVVNAIDSAFTNPRLSEFSLMAAKDGITFRRYYSKSGASERELSEMESIGVITEVDRKSLLNASIQQQTDYEREVQRWYKFRGT